MELRQFLRKVKDLLGPLFDNTTDIAYLTSKLGRPGFSSPEWLRAAQVYLLYLEFMKPLDGFPISTKPSPGDHRVIGHLIGGGFKCERCAVRWQLVGPDAMAVYAINIWPYSQVCNECGVLIVDGFRNAKGDEPLVLFEKGLE